jgi:hypothetical protein
MTTAQMLIELNARRTAANMKPLKAWKDSKAKLQAAIDKLAPATDEEFVTLSGICRELGKNEKSQRNRIRRTKGKDLPPTTPEGREVHRWPASCKQQIIDWIN